MKVRLSKGKNFKNLHFPVVNQESQESKTHEPIGRSHESEGGKFYINDITED